MLACTYRPLNTSRLLIAQGAVSRERQPRADTFKGKCLGECNSNSKKNAQGDSHGQTRLLKENAQGQPKPESLIHFRLECNPNLKENAQGQPKPESHRLSQGQPKPESHQFSIKM